MTPTSPATSPRASPSSERGVPSNEYHFVTRWRVRASIQEVSDILGEAEALPRWWPSVYLSTQVLRPGDEHGVGKVVSLHTRGWLPYTLRWCFRVVEANPPHGFALEAWGDFVGRGVWRLVQRGPDTLVTYDWKIRADKPLLRYGSPLLKPIFAANHRWAMAQGVRSLRAEIARRHRTPAS
ncbi:MAG: SRPBCC family protein [Chloroflexi bacterium]|nr:SRPBCC family protein [Chloroflexota bacterium]